MPNWDFYSMISDKNGLKAGAFNPLDAMNEEGRIAYEERLPVMKWYGGHGPLITTSIPGRCRVAIW